MSMKIYNGYKIPATSLEEVVDKLFGNKDKFKELIESKIHEDILTRAINTYYGMCFSTFLEHKNTEKNSSALGKIISQALDDENDRQIRERDMVDISICLIPNKQTVNKEEFYLLMLFAGEYERVLTNSPLWESLGIEEYAYWDNTDPPEELTEGEWEVRGKQWEKYVGYNTPAQSSLIIEYKKEYKYNCLYALDKETLTSVFEKSFEKTLLNLSKKQKSLLSYYEEMVKDKIAYQACSAKYTEEQLNTDIKNSLQYESRQYSRNNEFTELENNEINVTINKMKKIFKQPISFDNLFDKKDIVEEKTKALLSRTKPRM